MADEFSVKDSVNLPKTSFKMQANLVQNEPKMLRFWNEIDLYHKIIAKNEGRPSYILHDGPPYANGNIHLGHALNKILKDFIVKYKSMKGFYSPYVPGWDCHGLPIEKKMEMELGFQKKQMDILEFRLKCREYANKYIGIQKEQFKRLGVFGEWDKPYLTMDYSYEATIARVFGEFVGMGNVYKGEKPVLWCISCQTALAEAEVEYQDHKSPSVFVKFPAKTEFSKVVPEIKGKNVAIVIWTTTPWTIPANLAIALHPEFDYVAVQNEKEVYIVAEGLVENFLRDCAIPTSKIIARFKGRVLEGNSCRHPFIERDSVIVLADYVTLDQGTGCVHTAPGHGQEDYMTGQKYGLPTLCPVNEEGIFTEEGGRFSGQQVFEANHKIVQLMSDDGTLLHSDLVSHSYPHCWRCHNPVIFRSTPQWFIALDSNELRQKALTEIRKAKWYPEWGEERITAMVANRPDWCISRQRFWGVPITVFYCTSCGHTLMSKEIVFYIASIFERESSDAWYRYNAGELLPKGTRCPNCKGNTFDKEFDILDVWFDSGVSYEAVCRSRADHKWPADMYLEGGDQYRGWFHSSLLASLGCRNSAPYREVLTHGWVLDREGLAMSKSRGNVIEPEEIISDSGAEILRLWVGSVEYKEDIKISTESLARLKEAYRKIRNTMRFMLANLYREGEKRKDKKDPFNFNPSAHTIPIEAMKEIDRWALAKTAQVLEKCINALDVYDFYIVYHTIYQFFTVELSAVYFDILKDRLYTMHAESSDRRSAQTALWNILNQLVRVLAPFLPFTTEEVWQAMHKITSLCESVHLAEFPSVEESWKNQELLNRWERLFIIKEKVSKALEVKRQEEEIGNSLEAKVVIKANESDADFLMTFEPELRYVFIVSETKIEKMHMYKDQMEVVIERAEGEKCERCWNYSTKTGEYQDFPTVCERCIETVRKIAE